MNRRTLGFLTFKVIPALKTYKRERGTETERESETEKTETFHTKCCQPTWAAYTDFDISWHCSAQAWAALAAVNATETQMLHSGGVKGELWDWAEH